MFTIFLLAVALIGSAIAGIWDLKTTDIPDQLVFGMAGIGIFAHALQSFITADPSFILSSLAIGGIFTIFGVLMYYAGAWGGGDGALLASIGFLLPNFQPIYSQSFLPFSLAFFINVFLIGAVYSIVYSMLIAVKNKKIKNTFFAQINKDKFFIMISFAVSFFIIAKIQHMLTYFLSILIILIIPVYRLAKIVEKGLTKKIQVKNLKKGDMIGEDLPKLKIFKKQIRGLTEKEIAKIKRAKKFVFIRDGIRYGPVFFIALSLAVLHGSVMPFLI